MWRYDEQEGRRYELGPGCMKAPDAGDCKIDHLYYDLLLSENKSIVPPKCEEFFQTKKGDNRESKNDGIDTCKPKIK
ncbi:uncharacterized protein [Dermacentor andersoni]